MVERVRAALWGGLVAVACGAASGHEPRKPVPTGPTPAATVSVAADTARTPVATPGPVHWVLLPPASHWLPTFQRKTDVGTLYGGPGNERWLLHEGVLPRGTGPDAVALAGALKRDDGYAFITPAGAVYNARSPLGDLSLAFAPSNAAVDAASGRDHFLVIDGSGKLQRSADLGKSWQTVDVPRHSGALSDVVMLETGAGLVLANHAGKSQLFSTRDDGATWRKVDSKGYAFTGLVSYEEQLQAVVSVSRKYDYYRHAILDDALSRVTGEGQVLQSNTPFGYPVAVPPDAATFVSARAGRPLRWVVLREASWEPSVWELGVAPFGELPSYRAVEAVAGCALTVAGAASEIAIACRHLRSDKSSLFLSDDEGRSFREFPLPRSPVALYALGDALVAQMPCDGPVETRGPFLLAPPTWRARRVSDTTCRMHLGFTSAAEPGAFLSVAWSDSKLTLHRWPAGDATPALVSTVADAPSWLTTVTLSRDGSTVVLGMVVGTSTDTLAGGALFRSLDAGQHFSAVALPTAFGTLALFGRRGMGVGHDGRAWTTQDSGATWARIAAPLNVGYRPIECNDSGCITARGLRVGWER